MPDVFEWRHTPPGELLVQALEKLAAGGLVVFPTDTCYLACACATFPEAIRRLLELPPVESAPPQAAVAGVGPALDWVPDLPLLGQRLARRLWPGPLTLVCPHGSKPGLLEQLPAEVVSLFNSENRLQLRAPAHEGILQILQNFSAPILCRPLCREDGTEITNAAEAAGLPLTGVNLLITDGDTYFSKPATTILLIENRWEILKPGVVTEADLQRLSTCQIVFVCTGNTCRSPMAEALCKKMLSDQLGCAVEELPARGFLVQSAGMAAFPGYGASPEGVAAVREFGADLSNHSSQPLTGELLFQADHVFTMTASHLNALAPHSAAMLLPPSLLSCEGEDVLDPIGAEPEVYRECARQIQHHLQRRLPEFRPH